MDYLFKMGLPNIIQQINSKLPLSGGTITGKINITMINGRNEGGLHLYSGNNNAHGANIQLFRNDHADYPGKFYIRASLKSSWDDTNLQSCDLIGYPNGTLTWGGNNVITSAGGTFAGAIECASSKYSETTSNEAMVLSSYGINLRNSDIIGINGLYFNDASSTHEEGINFPDGTNMFSTISATGGKLYFTPKRTFATTGTKQDVVCVTKWTSGTSGYRKYTDGLIEQWGRSTTSGNAVITLPLAFSNTSYNLTVGGGNSGGVWAYGNIISTTQIQVGLRGTQSFTQPTHWFACGY